MAAKTIQEALTNGFNSYLDTQTETDLANELRDFFAHEIMRMQGAENKNVSAMELFEKVFAEVPALGKKDYVSKTWPIESKS